MQPFGRNRYGPKIVLFFRYSVVLLLFLMGMCSMNVTSSSSDAMTSAGVRPKSLGRESTTTLKTWLLEHIKNPYPSKGEKIMLAVMTRMTLTQVSTWFANARRRLKKEYRVRWLDDNDEIIDDDIDDDDDDDDTNDSETDKRDGDDSQLQRRATHLKTSEDASVYSEPDIVAGDNPTLFCRYLLLWLL